MLAQRVSGPQSSREPNPSNRINAEPANNISKARRSGLQRLIAIIIQAYP